MKSWPHSPLHSFNETGTYMLTGATLYKEHYFRHPEDLDLLRDLLMTLAEKYGWRLEAWALFSNHYHFLAQSPDNPTSLGKFISHFHTISARELNRKHGQPGRRVWYQFWDSRITFQKSYLARLNYVMQNPVKHKLVEHASQYEWCSASWFENNATPAYRKTILAINTDDVAVEDDY